MKDRILKFLSVENKSSAQFAEEIGVQPSGVSHILSGRNNPSLDFVMKMLHKYPNLSTEWLLFGKEPMYKRVSEPTLFDELPTENRADNSTNNESVTTNEYVEHINRLIGTERALAENDLSAKNSEVPERSRKQIDRIVFFYKDKSFSEYNPEN